MFTKNLAVRVFNFDEEIDVTLSDYADKFARMHISPDDIASYPAEEKSFALCDPNNLFNKNVLQAEGEYLYTGIVFYTRAVPAKAVKFEYEKWRRTYISETGKKFVSREQASQKKEEIKEDILKKTPVQPKVVPIVIDPARHRVYVFSLSNKVIDQVSDLFSRSFFTLYEDTFLREVESEELIDEKDLGGNFLTWLWFATETNSYKEYSGEGVDHPYTITPDDGITVVGEDGDVCSVKGDIREARNGVFNGKKVDRFAFVLYSGEISTPCVVWSNGMLARVSVHTTREDIEAGGEVFVVIRTIECVREFLKLAVLEYAEIYNDPSSMNETKKEIWNWSRGDVCIKSFEGI